MSSIEHSFEVVLQRFDSKLWGHHFIVPKDVSKQLIEAKISRLVCLIGKETSFHCGMMPAGQGKYFINVNKEVRAGARWKVGESRHVSLMTDESEYGMPVPIELEECLRLDPDGSILFHQLTPGKQRSLIYLAAKPKKSDTRLKKSIIILDYLKDVNGLLDYKELNQAFKDRKDEF